MSSIVWVLSIIASGMYGMPVPVKLTFDTEAACESAKATVTVDRIPNRISCDPVKKENK